MKSRIVVAVILIASLPVVSAPAPAQRPSIEPFFSQFQDVNPCTGETITFTFQGTVRAQEFGDHVLQHISGTATTSDGYAGKFHAQFVAQGDRVSTFFEHDMEVNADHQRMFFHIILHTTSVDGRVTADVAHVVLECVGRK